MISSYPSTESTFPKKMPLYTLPVAGNNLNIATKAQTNKTTFRIALLGNLLSPPPNMRISKLYDNITISQYI